MLVYSSLCQPEKVQTKANDMEKLSVDKSPSLIKCSSLGKSSTDFNPISHTLGGFQYSIFVT